MSDMVARGCEANVVTYSVLISSLCRDGKVEREGGREQGKEVVQMRFGPGGSRVGEDIMCHNS